MKLERRFTNSIRKVLDNWLPPVVRESAPFARAVKLWLGSRAMPDFKFRAFRMSPKEFSDACAAVDGAYAERSCDTTPRQCEWILERVGNRPNRLLEIGPGNGILTERLKPLADQITVLDVYPRAEVGYLIGTVESIPLPSKSVDVTVLTHVIEHTRSLTRAFLEMERVTRDKVLIVTPRQRFYRVTFDYHLHFFYSLDHLASHIPCGTASGEEVDGDLCLEWHIR